MYTGKSALTFGQQCFWVFRAKPDCSIIIRLPPTFSLTARVARQLFVGIQIHYRTSSAKSTCITKYYFHSLSSEASLPPPIYLPTSLSSKPCMVDARSTSASPVTDRPTSHTETFLYRSLPSPGPSRSLPSVVLGGGALITPGAAALPAIATPISVLPVVGTNGDRCLV